MQVRGIAGNLAGNHRVNVSMPDSWFDDGRSWSRKQPLTPDPSPLRGRGEMDGRLRPSMWVRQGRWGTLLPSPSQGRGVGGEGLSGQGRLAEAAGRYPSRSSAAITLATDCSMLSWSVSTTTSGLTGSSYGSETPVNWATSPRSARS